MNRYKDWLKQAEKDIEAATDSEIYNHYEWACFQSQQSAEKALKALLLFLNIDSWGYGLVHLMKEYKRILDEEKAELNEDKFKELIEKCQELDRHYIQPRYPNGFASGYPAEYYNQKTAKESIEYAKSIFQFVKEKIKEISQSE
ncbi:MAG: HEPN domain-containing protein [Promethearchaeota archaeon]